MAFVAHDGLASVRVAREREQAQQVARLHLAKLGARLTNLSSKQADYLGIPQQGPFKSEQYRY